MAASFDATWDAVIDHFAYSNIPIRTIEKASGLIATDRLRVDLASASEYADCGASEYGTVYYSDFVVYNVLVRAQGEHSTILITATWDATDGPFGCTTRGVWEEQTTQAIRVRAER